MDHDNDNILVAIFLSLATVQEYPFEQALVKHLLGILADSACILVKHCFERSSGVHYDPIPVFLQNRTNIIFILLKFRCRVRLDVQWILHNASITGL